MINDQKKLRIKQKTITVKLKPQINLQMYETI